MTRRLVCFMTMTLIVSLSGCGKNPGGDANSVSTSGITKLKMGHALDTEHPVHKAMVFMAEKLKEKSDGNIILEVYPGEQLGSESELVEQVQLGLTDMTKVSTAPMESFVPIYSVFSLPYIFRDSEHYWKVLEGPIGKQLLAAGESKGFKGLCYYDSGSRSFYTKEKPILSPDDLAGMKIRVMNSKTSIDMIKQLGASSTPISWGELYTSLQQGVVDGAENNPPSFYRSGQYEVCKHYSLDEHTMIPDIVLMSMETWKKLSAEQQQMVQEAVDESVVYQRELWTKDSEEALKIVQEEGVTVYNPEKGPFKNKVKQMLTSYEGTEVGELIEQIEQVK